MEMFIKSVPCTTLIMTFQTNFSKNMFKIHAHTLRTSRYGQKLENNQKNTQVDRGRFLIFHPSVHLFKSDGKSAKSLLQGRPSNDLRTFPISNSDKGELVTYQPINYHKPIYAGKNFSINFLLLTSIETTARKSLSSSSRYNKCTQ